MRTNVNSWIADLGPREYAFTAGLAIVLIAVLMLRHRRGVVRPVLILDGVFGVYLIFLAVVVFCPLPGLTPPPSFADVPAVWVNTTVDLHGFLGSGLDSQNRQNLLLLVPFGFGLPFVVRWRGWALIAAGAILPLGIEGMQLLVSLLVGWHYRSVDLNDWVANVAGALLGLAVFAELSWVLSRARPLATGDPQRQVRAHAVWATRRFREPGDIQPEAAHCRRTTRTAAVAALAVVSAAVLVRSMGPAETPAYGSACEGTVPAGAVTLTQGYSAYTDRGLLCLTYPGGSQATPTGSPEPILNSGERGIVTVVGQAPAATARAVVTLPDGRSTDAKLHRVEGLTGWLVYTAELGRADEATKDALGNPGAGPDPSSVRVEFLSADGLGMGQIPG